ncbi:ubiquitin C-terminal hydrolase family protein [Purpureocillium lavendulum]|uniref:Ubiquitin C-terminal hydrolase family protein n=1 Tax=Purpureocillium lavendulum TaxID=1247861 RepID=A0AB34FIZ2_9HYPO|nr:ubiquitin C-terminal hydrolase family protein [Purpureocillium lavendulum]
MAPANSKANYKTYEAQARMVRAIVAAHPDVKWNYKDIVVCYGSDMTDHALNHRFRRFRAQAIIVREARRLGYDMKDMMPPDDLPDAQDRVDKTNIAKYFGQSTADGMQFQFRAIKKDAEKLRHTVAENGDASSCLNLSATPSAATTPSKSVTTPTSSRRSGPGTARKRRVIDLKQESSDDDGTGAEDSNYSERDQTPSKRSKTAATTTTTSTSASAVAGGGLVGTGAAGQGATGQKNVTPRRAAQKANVTIASAAAQLQDSESPTPPIERKPTMPVRQAAVAAPVAVAPSTERRPSLFGGPFNGGGGGGGRPRAVAPVAPAALPSAFARNGSDVYMTSTARPGGSFSHDMAQFVNDDFEDGEY